MKKKDKKMSENIKQLMETPVKLGIKPFGYGTTADGETARDRALYKMQEYCNKEIDHLRRNLEQAQKRVDKLRLQIKMLESMRETCSETLAKSYKSAHMCEKDG